MKATKVLLAIFALVILQPNTIIAQSAKAKSYKMTVQGTSTLHEWESVVEKLECKASYAIEKNILREVKDVVVKIPVTSIKSPKGKMMDSKTHDAFNYEKNPLIIFSFANAKVEGATITTKGNLTMAGVTKTIDLQFAYRILPNGDLEVTGEKKLRMTDFKMEPPTAMMGTIKVGDEVTINFEITLTNTNTIL